MCRLTQSVGGQEVLTTVERRDTVHIISVTDLHTETVGSDGHDHEQLVGMCIFTLMDGPRSDRLVLVLCLLFLLCDRDNGADQGLSCVSEVRVRRNTAFKAVPLNRLTINCTVKHCGDVPNITWCKFLDSSICKPMTDAGNIKVSQKKLSAHEVMSFLFFKKISMDDQGQYRCYLAGNENSVVSHAISVNVSERDVGFEYSGNNTGDIPTSKYKMDVYWLPYVGICMGVLLLVVMVTAIFFFSLDGCEGPITSAKSRTKVQEASTPAACPDPNSNPKGTLPSSSSSSSSSSNPNNNQLNNLYDSCINGPLQHSYLLMSGTPPSSDIADGDHGSSQLVYAALNHQNNRGPPKPSPSPRPLEEATEYAAIRTY
ncbi:B- and T-lymphocyte attenuator-like isoform X1 [Esox lucius]|uniref:Ig-like domain-containing protein n=1 Tax=Esox lucius TaxID=8010 RepID=A0AAY5JZP1_ESOLU|nr:B- and T-lymphocyte attenuator-like isoform X1 [Esox lucius]